ncbi:hypothetical protein CU098_012551 [Rhizopus stolonifer]|uniref:Homologous-pairing protein 2 winged helix domain-containing protein n=1 Tax=Rhizopus stolonifer TaxID=4846 RepID=A0A367KKH8_RHIST|nr:hypothetical protein CU098_012551 [Rhizopus stolonifer]
MAKKKSSGTSKEEVIAKVLERLIDEDLVFSKTYGKTLIYSVKQAKDENGPSEQDIEKMEKSMIELDQKYEELLAENKKLEQINK